MALARWCYRDPAEAVDIKRKIEANRAERSREGKAKKAREGLEALFERKPHASKAQIKY